MKKRALSLFLVSVFLLIAFSACGADPVVKVNEDEKAAGVDLGGYNFRYYQTKTLSYIEDTLFADLAMERVKNVEENLNCTIEFLEGKLQDELLQALAIGEVLCDAGTGGSFGLQTLFRSDCFLPISQIESIIKFREEPQKWGNKNQLASFVWNNELYGVLPMYYPEFYYDACDFAIFVNEDIVAGLGQPDPREFVENSEWNRDKMTELIKLYHHEEGEDTVYGIGMFINHFFDITLRTAGIEYAVKENGAWVSGLHTQKALDELTWAQNLIFVDCKDYIRKDYTYPAIDAFVNGENAMLLTHVGFGLKTVDTTEYKSISFNMENFGILPFPLSEDMPKNQWIGQHENMDKCVIFPVNIEQPETAAQIINAIYEPFEEYKTEEERRAYYMRFIFHDERDANIIFQMLDNSRYTYYIDGARGIVDTLSSNGARTTVSEVLESSREQYQTVLEEVIIPSYESIENIWG